MYMNERYEKSIYVVEKRKVYVLRSGELAIRLSPRMSHHSPTGRSLENPQKRVKTDLLVQYEYKGSKAREYSIKDCNELSSTTETEFIAEVQKKSGWEVVSL